MLQSSQMSSMFIIFLFVLMANHCGPHGLFSLVAICMKSSNHPFHIPVNWVFIVIKLGSCLMIYLNVLQIDSQITFSEVNILEILG